MKINRIILIFLLVFCLFGVQARVDAEEIYLITIDGIIGPPMANYVVGNIEKAEEEGAHAILLEVNTPGGLDTSMREIIKSIMNSPLPVIGYVAPEGARAASAGSFIIIACDINAMTPTSSIGAAHPVSMGGTAIDSTMEQKVLNDILSYMTSIAEKRGRNAEVARRMITESISLTAEEAQAQNIVDFVARSQSELLTLIDSTEIEKNDETLALHTKNATVIPKEMSVIERFFYHISDPNIAYILLILGIYGLLAEFSAPGIGFAGVVGTICLILALFGLSTLPVNIAGILLIVAGVILLVLEIRTPSFGIVGIGGIVAIVLGSLMLIPFRAPSFLRISISLIIGVAIFTALFLLLLLTLVIKVHRKGVTTGKEGILGSIGYAKSELNPDGMVWVRGELWQAESVNGKIEIDEPVEIIDMKNLKLFVKKGKK
jgi:membrane-bound serine protease (ClpP class)